MTADFDRELQRLEGKLKALRSKEYIPDALLEIVARTAAIQLEARAAAQADQPDVPSTELAAGLATPEAHAQGAPLLPRDAFTYDRARTAATFGRLLAMMRAAGGSLGAAAEVVREAMEKGELAVEDACDAALRDDVAWFDAWALRLNDAPSLVRFLAMGSVVPSVEALALAVAAEHARRTGADQPGATPVVWQHGHCPVCGSAPLVGRLVGKEGALHHTCSFCRHEYRAKRLQCPFCLENESKNLEYFTADGEPGFQVHVCKSCKGYIKVADFREFDRISIPVLDDLESLALDIVARRQGYARPTASAWGF